MFMLRRQETEKDSAKEGGRKKEKEKVGQKKQVGRSLPSDSPLSSFSKHIQGSSKHTKQTTLLPRHCVRHHETPPLAGCGLDGRAGREEEEAGEEEEGEAGEGSHLGRWEGDWKGFVREADV